MTTPNVTRQKVRPAISLHPWRAFFLASLLYFFLGLRQMTEWSKPVWILLAFIAIPGLCALALGKTDETGKRVRASMWSIGLAMGIYTGFNLMLAHARINSGDSAFMVGLVVTIVYWLVAGGVASVIGMLRDNMGTKDK